jgi:2,5-diketo-D-gluconate reductase A
MKKSLTLFSSVLVLAVPSFGEHVGPSVTLNNGLEFPSVSFGLQVYDDATAEKYTGFALQAGVKNFFASVLAGNQAGFGRAVQKYRLFFPRETLFICGSVNTGGGQCTGHDDCKAKTSAGCASNLKIMGLEQLDMIMLDYPASDCPSIQGQWAAFEEMLASHLTRSLAVSNFSPDQLKCILKLNGTVPAVNQMSYSVGHGKDTTVADDAALGDVLVQAYSPLAGGSLVHDKDLVAIGEKYGVSAVQVALRWILQRNATFTTSASTKAHFKSDLDIFNFALSGADMKQLNAKTG